MNDSVRAPKGARIGDLGIHGGITRFPAPKPPKTAQGSFITPIFLHESRKNLLEPVDARYNLAHGFCFRAR